MQGLRRGILYGIVVGRSGRELHVGQKQKTVRGVVVVVAHKAHGPLRHAVAHTYIHTYITGGAHIMPVVYVHVVCGAVFTRLS
jgi:hypothetical protein